MFVTTPEIVWHNKEPVFGIDFHHNGSICRVATAGADQTVKLWRLIRDNKMIKVVFLASLERHSKSVNTVRFSPDGQLLASAGDDCIVCLWKLNRSSEERISNNLEDQNNENKENWTIAKMMRGHIEDVYDLCWSDNSQYLMSGSVDNSVIIWDCKAGEKVTILKESHHYIQGVAWGCNGYLATLGTDRCLRIYNNKFKCIHSIMKRNSLLKDKLVSERLFHDESMSSFFRRLSFSPDGLILVAPSGKIDGGAVPNVTWVFAVSSLPKPVMYLSGCDKPSLVVRFSPVLYQLNDLNKPPLFDLPYRMVFAVGTIDTIILYDTQQTTPIGIISDIHYTSVTDLTWSDDGLLLMISSTDGYCTVIGLTQEEMGVVYTQGNATSNSCSSPFPYKECVETTPLSQTQASSTTTINGGTGAKTPRRINFITLSNNTIDK